MTHASEQNIEECAKQNTDGVSGHIDPGKHGAQHEVADGGVADRIDPRLLVNLRELDCTRYGESQKGKAPGGGPRLNESQPNENHQ